MQRIEGTIRNYAWGSRTAIARLRGESSPADHPEAEMWFGAHPGAPSPVVGADKNLAELIAAHPQEQLGSSAELPFLLKILAADKALSIQAHPTKAQAEEGYARENGQGIALDAFHRNYKDDNHKPELLVAVTEFSALAGFRPVSEVAELLDVLDVAELRGHRAMLGSGDDAADLRSVLTTWITLPNEVLSRTLQSLVRRCEELCETGADHPAWIRTAAATVVELAAQHPGDSGVLCAMLLNIVELQPGQALYLDAGQLHAYLRGLGVEIMANSDNVLRGGLTTKHMDVPELMHVVQCAPLDDPSFEPDEFGVYHTPAPEFELRRLHSGDTVAGPAIVLCVSGSVSCTQQAGDAAEELAPTQAVWVAASEEPVAVDLAAETVAFAATADTS
ncbi:MAG TPA: mannose-6-phosphate isomerase, class I [Candidatus Corynebacterium gallistercoris]|uniref:mannose-6-phosphate isomerase n=1 Tax=Candidatus Corynebacterium gallistercoris TaxID=2838530 RepID=A0A9D1UPJ8_9CORY|nr:mannose-6-phosphate isomerase, class I [Candidatus Corynebacterium gallistercoris]